MREQKRTGDYNRYLRFIPLVGICALLILFLMNQPDTLLAASAQSKLSTMERMAQLGSTFTEAFDFSNMMTIIYTTLILITLWTSYTYWLKRNRFFRRKRDLTKHVIMAIMLIVFVSNHVRLNSQFGHFVDWILFIAFLYLVIAGTWLLANLIDSIDLHSDLYCWGLRLLGLLVLFFGVTLFMSSTFALVLSNSKLVFNNIYWITSICIMLLGCFMEYRSFRRHPAIMVW